MEKSSFKTLHDLRVTRIRTDDEDMIYRTATSNKFTSFDAYKQTSIFV